MMSQLLRRALTHEQAAVKAGKACAAHVAAMMGSSAQQMGKLALHPTQIKGSDLLTTARTIMTCAAHCRSKTMLYVSTHQHICIQVMSDLRHASLT